MGCRRIGNVPTSVSETSHQCPRLRHDPLPLPDKPSIAVLPFQNMSGDPEQEYFADGMVEDIITGLSRFKSLFVIARNSSFTYKGKPVDIRQVGRELGVRYVLEGSVRKAGNRVRITGQLDRRRERSPYLGRPVRWRRSKTYSSSGPGDSEASSVPLRPIEQAENERAKRKPGSLHAYDYLLRARCTLDRVTTAARWKLALSRQAIDLEPDFALAYADCGHLLRSA